MIRSTIKKVESDFKDIQQKIGRGANFRKLAAVVIMLLWKNKDDYKHQFPLKLY